MRVCGMVAMCAKNKDFTVVRKWLQNIDFRISISAHIILLYHVYRIIF